MSWVRGVGMLALGLLGACAEVVILPDDGGAGSGGGGPPPSTTAACEEACENRNAQCDYVGGSCIDQCLEGASYLAACAAQYEATVRCRATIEWLDKPECDKPQGSCVAEADALLACLYPTGECQPKGYSCVPGEGGTTCTILCGGVSYVSLCSADPSTGKHPLHCTCQIDGEVVGSCQNVSGNGTWLWGFGGCCNTYFAEGP